MPIEPIFFDTVQTSLGKFYLAATKRGLVRISFPPNRGAVRQATEVPSAARRALNSCKRFLRSYMSGRSAFETNVPVDWSAFSRFDRLIFKRLQHVPHGSIVSYGELAARLGFPRAARALGNALARNPIPVLIPCHRVIRSNRSLGGFQRGARWKRILLRIDRKIASTQHR